MDKLALKQESRLRYHTYIRSCFDRYQPDLVFIMNGENLATSTIAYFHKKSKVVFWLFDSITRMWHTLDNLREADTVFCYEQSDIAILAQKNISASFLPQAVDTTLYYPIKGIVKKYDIVFAGEIWNSKKRQQLLETVVSHFSDKRIRIVGRYNIPTKDFFGWLFRKNRKIYTNTNASVEELNLLYNQSRVVLNIHNEQQQDGANPKVYEILASGAIEICDTNPYIESEFSSCDNMILYANERELCEAIDKALSAQARPANYDISQYTFCKRIETVLSSLQ